MNRIGIICALYFEASCFTRGKPVAQQPVRLNEQTLLIVSGMGRDKANRAAQKLIEENASCLISFGTAGALSPALKPGDLVQPEGVLDMGRSRLPVFNNTDNLETQPEEVPSAGRRYDVNACLPAATRQRLSQHNISVHSGPLVSMDEEIATTDAKLKLSQQTGAIAVDMETAGILDAAEHHGLPASALRIITDSADMAIPDAILRRINDFGEVNGPGLVIDLIMSPGQIPAVLCLGRASRRAGKTMNLVAEELLTNSC